MESPQRVDERNPIPISERLHPAILIRSSCPEPVVWLRLEFQIVNSHDEIVFEEHRRSFVADLTVCAEEFRQLSVISNIDLALFDEDVAVYFVTELCWYAE